MIVIKDPPNLEEEICGIDFELGSLEKISEWTMSSS